MLRRENMMKTILNLISGFFSRNNNSSKKSTFIIIGCIIFVILAYSAGRSASRDKLAKFIKEYDDYKKSAEVTIRYADSLSTRVKILTDSVRRTDNIIGNLSTEVLVIQTEKVALKNKLTKLNNQLNSITDTSSILIMKDSIIDNLSDQIIVSDNIIVKKDSIISIREIQIDQLKRTVALATHRGDSLQIIVLKLPATPSNPNKIFGFIPMPSRTVVGVISFAVGAYVGHTLVK
jgi:hypothetical protein